MKKILFIIITFFLFISTTYAKEDNLVNIYLFHSKTCQHCKKEIKLLEELKKEYDNIKIYKFEVSTTENNNLFNEVTNLLNIDVSGVPFTIIGGKYFSGFNEEKSKKTFIATIEYYTQNGYIDKVGEYLNVPLPTYEINPDATPIDDYIKNYGNYTFNLPIIGKVNTNNLTMPLTAVVIGIVDNFNPCTMLALLFLITLLIELKDRKKTLLLSLTFILTSGIIYFLIILLGINLSNTLNNVTWIKILVGTITITLGSYNLITNFIKSKYNIKRKNLLLPLITIIILTININILCLTSSANLPIIFTKILSLANLSKVEEIYYILVYVFFLLLDDIIIFITLMLILKPATISTKHRKIIKIVKGLILIIMGILLLI